MGTEGGGVKGKVGGTAHQPGGPASLTNPPTCQAFSVNSFCVIFLPPVLDALARVATLLLQGASLAKKPGLWQG